MGQFSVKPRYLLCLEDAVQRRHLTIFVGSEHFTEGAGGNAAGDAVDVDLLCLVIFTHRLLLFHLWDWSAGHIHTRTCTRAHKHACF